MRAHFWCCACGVVLLVFPLVAGGVVEQAKLENTNEPFLAAMRSTLPFLRVSTIGDLLLLIGHGLFLTNIGGLVFGFYRARAEATYEVLTADLFKTAAAKP
jgi:cbb3-type cytochrome oxidase subunit 1